jgi:hypothetical protein
MQFRLSTLCLAMVVVATSVAMAGPLGVPLAGYCFLLSYAIRAAIGERPGGCMILFAVLLPGACLCLLPTTSSCGPAARRSQCANNMKQLALALEIYRDVHGSCPPPYLADNCGKPIHSWRVLILPHAEQAALWKRYRFSEPWDGPNNSQLPAPSFPYCCPTGGKPAATNYVMVTGPGTASEAMTKGSPKNQAVPNRILLVEVANSGIDWKEPKDLTLDEARAGINPPNARGISSLHENGAHVAMTSGAVYFVPKTISHEDLEALLTGNLDDMAIGNLFAKYRDLPVRAAELRPIAWLASLIVFLFHGLMVDENERKRKSAAVPGRSGEPAEMPKPDIPSVPEASDPKENCL